MKTATKTDRLKLSGTNTPPQDAESIFKDVSQKTGVTVQWEPGKVTNGQKKEAVIKLCGSPEGVKIARNMILQNLEIQSNKVILKMDISHEEHPSLIGKKGILNKQMSEITNCLIHFPDINLKAATIKSNLVSITGEPFNVEKARLMLRALMPFQVTFDVDIGNVHHINTSLPLWKKIEEQLGLNIHFIQHKKGMYVSLKCSQGLFPSIRNQLLALIELLSQKRGSDLPPVKVVMDIMPLNHSFVKGPKGSNVTAISNRTGAKIMFPNLNSDSSQKRYVIITGNLDCVYMAWQEIMNSLPVVVSFDVSETKDTNNGCYDILLDCNISVSTKSKQKYIKGVTVKGPEKFSKQILQYRQGVLRLAPIKFQQDDDHTRIAFSLQSSNAEVSYTQILRNLHAISNDLSCNNSHFQEVINVLNMTNGFSQPFVPYNATLYPPITYIDIPPGSERLYERNKSYHNRPLSVVTPTCRNSGYSSSLLWGQNGINNNEVSFEESKQPHEQSNSFRDSFSNTENMLPDSTLRDPCIDQFEIIEKRLSAYQAIHRQIESTQVPSSIWAGYGFSQSMPAAFTTKEKDSLLRYSSNSLESNGISSSDDSFNSIVYRDYVDDKIWSNHGDNVFSMSNVFDFKTNTSLPIKFHHKDILPELLYKEGLYNYIDIFLKQEIDYPTFLMLTDSDLMNLGIHYQARMKITCLIRELQDSSLKTFDAAPGAERKISRNS